MVDAYYNPENEPFKGFNANFPNPESNVYVRALFRRVCSYTDRGLPVPWDKENFAKLTDS